MDGMDAGEYDNYLATQGFFDLDEIDSWELDDAFYNVSSPDGAASSSVPAKKSIAQERRRRNRFNEKLYTLRSLVPSITKLDKASIVKDAIDYILRLQEEERKLVAEMLEPGQGTVAKKSVTEHDVRNQTARKKRRTVASSGSPTTWSPINVAELKVHEVGDGSTSIVSITCSRRKDTVARLCEALEPLHLNIISANITSFSGNLLHTLFIEAPEMEGTQLREKMEAAISGYEFLADFRSAPR